MGEASDAAGGSTGNIKGLIGLAAGAAVGAAVVWVAKPHEQVEKTVLQTLSEEQIAEVCAEEVTGVRTELDDAQGKVQFLENEVVARSAQVRELEDEMVRRAEKGRELVAQLERAKSDLAEALEQLEIAREEKEALVAELTTTKEQLAETEEALVAQVKKTDRAKEDALVNKWYRFVSNSQLDICEKGSRKKLKECRDSVQASLVTNERRDRFAHCVRSQQAIPMVRELEKDEVAPHFSEPVDESEKATRDWLVVFCDPTLPEKGEGFLNEEHLPATRADGASSEG